MTTISKLESQIEDLYTKRAHWIADHERGILWPGDPLQATDCLADLLGLAIQHEARIQQCEASLSQETISYHTPEQTPSAPGSADLIRQQIVEAQSRLQRLSNSSYFRSEWETETEAVLASLSELITMLAVRIEQLQAPQPAVRPHEPQEAREAGGMTCSHPGRSNNSRDQRFCVNCDSWY